MATSSRPFVAVRPGNHPTSLPVAAMFPDPPTDNVGTRGSSLPCTAPPPRRRDRGIVRPVIIGGVLVGAALVGTGAVGLDLFDNPFSTTTVDRSPAPILTELRDLGEYHAAQASFEVIVDQEQDVNLVPQFLAGERVQFVAIGDVDALVDFTELACQRRSGSTSTSGAVTITLPSPTIAAPVLDHEQSHVMNRDRGLLDRIGGVFVDSPTTEHELLVAARGEDGRRGCAVPISSSVPSRTRRRCCAACSAAARVRTMSRCGSSPPSR